MKIIYIIGAITKANTIEKDMFEKIEIYLKKQGFCVINPYKIGKTMLKNGIDNETLIMKRLLKLLINCNNYVILPSIEKSYYGKFEIEYIELLNKYGITELKEIKL